MDGHVRAILWQHLGSHSAKAAPPAGDPNLLVPADLFAGALGAHVKRHPGTLRTLGHDYVTLWSRTFRTLVRHMRGSPERALELFATEVYPYLRGDRLAARVERPRPGHAHVIVHDDLPHEYVAGLIEGFVRLSGASAHCQVSSGAYHVEFRIDPSDRLVAMARNLAFFRVPLLLTSFLAALVGMAFSSHNGVVEWLPALAVVTAATAVQSGANAWHDLFHPRHLGPLSDPGLPRGWLWFQAIGSHATAAGVLIYLLPDRPWLWVFAAVGLVLSFLYGMFREHGWGPAIAAITHGPVIVTGAAYALGGWSYHLVWAWIPLGLLAAALLFLDDIADRPLDEASGKRTLVVRLPRRRQVATYVALVGAGLVSLVLHHWTMSYIAPAAILATAGVLIARHVHQHVDDPHGLAPARAGTLALYIAAAAWLALGAA